MTQLSSMATTAFPIVVVDDDEVEQMFVKRCFRKSGLSNSVYTAGDGLEGLSVLKQPTESGEALYQQTCLILLDLNMPRMDGFEFLAALRNDPDLCDLPVVVMTTSTAPEDYEKVQQYGVVEYLPKHCLSADCKEILNVIDRLN